MKGWWKMEMKMKHRETENVEEDGEQLNMFQMAAVGDGNGEKVTVGEWVSWERWERWDFDFMLITSKGRL